MHLPEYRHTHTLVLRHMHTREFLCTAARCVTFAISDCRLPTRNRNKEEEAKLRSTMTFLFLSIIIERAHNVSTSTQERTIRILLILLERRYNLLGIARLFALNIFNVPDGNARLLEP